MNSNRRHHLTDEEFVAFVLDDLPEDREQEVDQHLETCIHCTKALESFYESQETFPTEEWALRRQGFVAELRQRVIPSQKNSILSRLKAQLQTLTLPQGDWSLSLATAQAATGEQLEDGETDDGILRWRIIEDENRNLIIRFGTHNLDLEGANVHLQIGTWQQIVTLRQVAPDQVGAEATVHKEQREQLEISDKLRIKMSESFD